MEEKTLEQLHLENAASLMLLDIGLDPATSGFKHIKQFKLINKGGKKCIYVYPRGTHKSGNKRRTAEVAFVNEYGVKSRKMPAKPFIRTANEKSADAAHDAAARVYDEFLKSKNL